LIPYFEDFKADVLNCIDGMLFVSHLDFEPEPKLSKEDMGDGIEVDGPLECRKPEFVIDDIIDDLIENSPCKDDKLFRCPKNSVCVPATGEGRGYTCKCTDGLVMKNKVCVEKLEKVPIDDQDGCPDNFMDQLEKTKAHRKLKKPRVMDGKKAVVMQVELNAKGARLNNQTYTAFIDFDSTKCGHDFGKAVSDGSVDFAVFDNMGSRELYSLVGQKAIWIKTKWSKVSGTVLQITKNFPSLGMMLGDETKLEINQRFRNVKGKDVVVPTRDSFNLQITGDFIDPENKEFAECFDPTNLIIYVMKAEAENGYVVLNQNDLTPCYLAHKFGDKIDGECKDGAVINGEMTDITDKKEILFGDNSDFAQCRST